ARHLRRGRGPGRRTAPARCGCVGCGHRALARTRPPLRAPRRRPADPRGRGVAGRARSQGAAYAGPRQGCEAGEGPLIVLLHGFPEFWYAWRQQIEPLVAAGFRVVAPDTRGYNLSSKPEGVHAYDISLLAEDIRGLIHERGAQTAMLVGHDWGGSIAWAVAMNHPEVV